MNLTFRAKDLTAVATKHNNERLLELAAYRQPDNFIVLTADQFTEAELATLEELYKGRTDAGSVKLIKKIASFRRIARDPSGIKPAKLEALAAAVKALVEPTENRWLFSESPDGHLIPWFLYDVSYNPPDRGRPATCTLGLVAYRQHQRVSSLVHFSRDNLQKKTVSTLLAERGLALETPALVAALHKEATIHDAMRGLTGSQFFAHDTGFDCEEGYRETLVSMERDGQPDRVVMDDENDECRRKGNNREDNDSELYTNKYWEKGRSRDDSREELDDGFVVLPTQPYLKVFNFRLQTFVEIHADNLVPYAYTKDLAKKLVLPKETKDLVGLLMRSVDDLLDDIVRGKTGGVIVLATGHPGTGKTLTAEVFAEEIQKPLYAVQCSELGTDEEELEKRLNTVLERSMRWRAILLLDEADVYVRARGEDLHQNAIVGVFLRVLEYYRGVLFLTSNRQTIIDDAIMSRVSAWLQYGYPTGEALLEHWRVLSDQFKVDMTPGQVSHMAKAFPVISGRTIKNMLKLARMMAMSQGVAMSTDTLKYAAGFLKMETADVKS